MSDEIEQHILRRFEVVRKIGSGAYGHVWRVKEKKTEEVMALKKIFDAFQHSTDAQRTYRQIMFLKQFEHQNIVKLNQVFRAENDKDIYLTFEFMEADLHNVIRQNILQDVHKQYIIYQIGLALNYLHSGEVIHRDLKPSNILLNSQCFVKLCDFGLVRSIAKQDHNSPVLTEYVATRWYRAPQILLGANDYGKSVDMWSLGCILAEIMLGKPIFPGSSTLHQLQKILSFTGKPSAEDIEGLKSDLASSMIDTITQIKYKPPREWFPYCNEDMLDLVCGLLQFNPNKRLTVEQLLRHPYIKPFAGKGCEISAGKIFKIFNDEEKLTTKDYRALIYESVKEDRQLTASKTLAQSNLVKAPSKPISTLSPKYTKEEVKPGSGLAARQSPHASYASNPVVKPKTETIKELTSKLPSKKPTEFQTKQDQKPISVTTTTSSKQLGGISTSYISPKARVITSPTVQTQNSLKATSPTYKYIYGGPTTLGATTSTDQPYFSSIKKK